MASDEPRDASFGDLLRMYRRRSGLSQSELAEKARISSRAISDLERGVRRRAYHPTVDALASALSLGGDERLRFTSAVRRARSLRPTQLRITAEEHSQRVRQLMDIVLAGNTRVVSVTGPPASGKTRLAADAGHLLAEQQSVRTDYLSLEGCSRAEEVLTLADALPEREQSARAQAEVPQPYQKPRLLILDNLEHLLPLDSAINALLSRNENLFLIIVSRVTTHVPDARELSLPPP